MKRINLINALFATLIAAPAAFAGDYIPWHWDSVEEPTVVQYAPEQAAADDSWTSDIGW